jgi:hypothetical protein
MKAATLAAPYCHARKVIIEEETAPVISVIDRREIGRMVTVNGSNGHGGSNGSSNGSNGGGHGSNGSNGSNGSHGGNGHGNGNPQRCQRWERMEFPISDAPTPPLRGQYTHAWPASSALANAFLARYALARSAALSALSPFNGRPPFLVTETSLGFVTFVTEMAEPFVTGVTELRSRSGF